MRLPRTLNVLSIQVRIAAGSPSAWRDGIVESAVEETVRIRLLDDTVLELQVSDAEGIPSVGEPVAYHPVAEILTGAVQTTARITWDSDQ
ncbi:MAG: hypothetical protein SOH99_15560 [Acidipropionibacterium acidipropionici]|jgi:hypothetical protein|uniref:hypothetical protein n=1 Tax=Acidipropionibacterium acidipropionici TaxID=1748 RepID=UPI002F35796D